MKNEILEIKKEDAIKAYDNAEKKTKVTLEHLFGKKTFIKSVFDRIKTIKDVLDENGITQVEFDISCKELPKDEVAYKLIKLISKALNEEWVANWNNSEKKHFPFFRCSDGFRFVASGYGFLFRWDGCLL